MYGWVRATGLREHDAADVVQEVFRAVFTSIDRFRKERPTDRFRDWLWTITHRRTVDQIRRLASQPSPAGGTDAYRDLQELPADYLTADPSAASLATAALVRQAMRLVQGEFEQRTWKAFERTAIDGIAPGDVAEQLGMSLGAVYVARSRILKRLRAEIEDLL